MTIQTSLRTDLARLGLLACAALSLAACGRTRTVTTIPVASGTVGEAEPNDSAYDANFLGRLYPGGRVRILGRISSFDAYDGFALIAGEPMSVSFVLRATDPLADLDVCVYDPYLDEFVACFEAPGGLEVGSFDVLDPGAEFHVVVTPFAGTSDYELELVASCCSVAPLALGASDEGAQNAPAAAQSPRGSARLDAYRKAAPRASAETGEPGADEDREPARARGLLIEIDEAGGIDAQAVELVEMDAPQR